MRAQPIIKEAHIFDFDDTLAKSEALTHLYRNGEFVRSLTPQEYHLYKKQPEDEFDNSEFEDPYLILKAVPYIMWPLLEELDQRDDIHNFILTARHEEAKDPIYQFLISKGIRRLPKSRIYTIGDGIGVIDIPTEKRKVLEVLTPQYSKTSFYDDNVETIEFVKDIPNLNSYVVE